MYFSVEWLSRCSSLNLVTCAASHLQHVCDVKVDIALQLAIKELCSFDDDEVCWKVDTPCKRRCRNQDLNLLVQKQLLDNLRSGRDARHTVGDRGD